MKKHNKEVSLFDPEDEISKEPKKRSSASGFSILYTNVSSFGKTIARTLSLIALSYLAWRGAAEFFVTARNVSEAISLVVVGALLYIFLVK